MGTERQRTRGFRVQILEPFFRIAFFQTFPILGVMQKKNDELTNWREIIPYAHQSVLLPAFSISPLSLSLILTIFIFEAKFERDKA